MEELTYFDVVKRLIREREKQISETLMSGALESIEHYKFLQGELNALYYIEGELKELNKEKQYGGGGDSGRNCFKCVC